MKSNYARRLNRINILLSIHIALKLVIILILFVVLYTTIWLKEKYLTLIKTSIYIQIFIFLSTVFVMLSINNPKSFDICYPFMNYCYLILSILEKSIIIIEIIILVQNLQNFIKVFHECAYYRTYEEIIDKEYKRTCFYYITDYNNELPYKYICYYNSENEYYNKFCDGFICKKNYDIIQINTYIKCYGNVDRSSIHFSGDNEFYLKDIELINRYKSSNLYACFRKEKIIKNENIFNKDCPDSNPINKMLIFIYSDIILHLLIDFLFIYEFILLQKIKQIYGNLVLLQSNAPINYINDEDLPNNNNSNTNKQTCNTDHRELLEYPQTLNTFNVPIQNSQTIIIEPGHRDKNNRGNNIDMENQNGQEDDIEVVYNENTDKESNENNGVISRKAKILNFKNRNLKERKKKIIKINYGENIDNNLDKSKQNQNQRMAILDIKKDDEYEINRINFFIKKKTRKKRNKIKEEIGKDSNGEDIDKHNNKNAFLKKEMASDSNNLNIDINKDDKNSTKIFNSNPPDKNIRNYIRGNENEFLNYSNNKKKSRAYVKKSNNYKNSKLMINLNITGNLCYDIQKNSNKQSFKNDFKRNNNYFIVNSLNNDILKERSKNQFNTF